MQKKLKNLRLWTILIIPHLFNVFTEFIVWINERIKYKTHIKLRKAGFLEVRNPKI